jgi:ribonuclease Y
MNQITVMWTLPPMIMAFGIVIGYGARILLDRAQAASDRRHAKTALQAAREEADRLRREATLTVRDECLRQREAVEQECKTRRVSIDALETHIAERVSHLDQRVARIDQKEIRLNEWGDRIENEERALQAQAAELTRTLQSEMVKLSEIASLSRDEARRILLDRMETEVSAEGTRLIRKIQETTRQEAEASVREMLTAAMERYAGDHVSQVSTCRISLPSEEMKGRIIGREGRNIRALENETGCNILIDDTPEVVMISGFDPYRREIARLTIEKLVADGRIQPARIEDLVATVRTELDAAITKAGENALAELKLVHVSPDLIRTLGRLKFRHSYGQNVLQHSVETAHLMGLLASELGLDPGVAKRVGVFHDIGKALDHTIEGGHALIGADLLRRCGEAPLVVNAVAAHHHDAHADSAYAALASAVDALTAARPGARSEATTIALKRLEQLEAIARTYPCVKQSYALQAGREVRIFVIPEKIEDYELLPLARKISRQIEEQMKFPGQIKVTVIRETRCVEYAK